MPAAKRKTQRQKKASLPMNQAQAKADSKPSVPDQSRKYLLLAFVIILVAGLLYVKRGLLVAATVNGSPIGRLEVVRELEGKQGAQVLNTMIAKKLIEQEAKKRGIEVSDKEAESEVAKFEQNLKKQGQTLDQFLTLQGLTKEDLRKEMRLQRVLDKMLGKEAAVSDKEVEAYMQENKETLVPAGEEVTKAVKDQVRSQLAAQKLNDKIQALLEKLRKEAKIFTFVKY